MEALTEQVGAFSTVGERPVSTYSFVEPSRSATNVKPAASSERSIRTVASSFSLDHSSSISVEDFGVALRVLSATEVG